MTIIDYLYDTFPFYEQQGKKAYKPGMDTTVALDRYFGHPHRSYKTIHVAGTNGKGSTSSLLASVLQQHGYKTGLYTSPHLVDFGERIRVDGQNIPDDYVREFVDQHGTYLKSLSPSFFEVVTAMAFNYFKTVNIDIAVVEVGLGGRLDCTNVITPLLSVITNISIDHADLLGHTIAAIAREKAGIIKPRIPVVIGEYEAESAQVFTDIAAERNAPIIFADKHITLHNKGLQNGARCYEVSGGAFSGQNIEVGLTGLYQSKNTITTLVALEKLQESLQLTNEDIKQGLKHVVKNTCLQGRWQKVRDLPDMFCDTAHNEAGVALLVEQLSTLCYQQKHIVWGMVGDKDASRIIPLLPRDAYFYLTQPSVARAMPVDQLATYFKKEGFSFETHQTMQETLHAAKKNAGINDLIIISGSTFMVADALLCIKNI